MCSDPGSCCNSATPKSRPAWNLPLLPPSASACLVSSDTGVALRGGGGVEGGEAQVTPAPPSVLAGRGFHVGHSVGPILTSHLRTSPAWPD